ncbi:hypothetical protein PMIN04_004087 [Paraphaeosphaeria minitans]
MPNATRFSKITTASPVGSLTYASLYRSFYLQWHLILLAGYFELAVKLLPTLLSFQAASIHRQLPFLRWRARNALISLSNRSCRFRHSLDNQPPQRTPHHSPRLHAAQSSPTPQNPATVYIAQN